jgi:hypothetical protein
MYIVPVQTGIGQEITAVSQFHSRTCPFPSLQRYWEDFFLYPAGLLGIIALVPRVSNTIENGANHYEFRPKNLCLQFLPANP